MDDLLPTLDVWRAEGHRVGRAVVVRTFGSAPRREGAVLLVADDGRIAGSVSGGCVEGAAAEAVADAIGSGHSRMIRYGISDEQAWGIGLACGGTIDVLIEPEIPPEVIAAARRRGVAVVTRLPSRLPPPAVGATGDEGGVETSDSGEPPGPSEIVEAGGARGLGASNGYANSHANGHANSLANGSPMAFSSAVLDAAVDAIHSGVSRLVSDDAGAVFVEAFPRSPRLVAVGATEITRHLVGLASRIGYTTVVIDPRPAFAIGDRFPDADELLVAWPDDAFERLGLGPDDAVTILSHDPKVDEPAILEAFRRGARYVGAVGSRRTQQDRRERLVAGGLPEEDLKRLRGPIGLDLGGREPAETALAILAEIVAARRGGSGRPLVERSGPITVGA